MSAYFDNMRARISALKPEDAWDRAADLERGLVRDVTICVMLPGFPAQWKRRVHEAVLKYGVCTLPSNAPPRDFETFDEHRQLLHGLCQDLHTVFHGVAQEDAPGFNDNPRQALDVIYYARTRPTYLPFSVTSPPTPLRPRSCWPCTTCPRSKSGLIEKFY